MIQKQKSWKILVPAAGSSCGNGSRLRLQILMMKCSPTDWDEIRTETGGSGGFPGTLGLDGSRSTSTDGFPISMASHRHRLHHGLSRSLGRQGQFKYQIWYNDVQWQNMEYDEYCTNMVPIQPIQWKLMKYGPMDINGWSSYLVNFYTLFFAAGLGDLSGASGHFCDVPFRGPDVWRIWPEQNESEVLKHLFHEQFEWFRYDIAIDLTILAYPATIAYSLSMVYPLPIRCSPKDHILEGLRWPQSLTHCGQAVLSSVVCAQA